MKIATSKKEVWLSHVDLDLNDKSVKVLVSPLTPKEIDKMLREATKSSWKRNQLKEDFQAYEYKENKINKVIKDWKGFEDENGKAIPCNAEMKKVIYLYNPDLIDTILAKADELTTLEESIKEAEVKN